MGFKETKAYGRDKRKKSLSKLDRKSAIYIRYDSDKGDKDEREVIRFIQ